MVFSCMVSPFGKSLIRQVDKLDVIFLYARAYIARIGAYTVYLFYILIINREILVYLSKTTRRPCLQAAFHFRQALDKMLDKRVCLMVRPLYLSCLPRLLAL